MAVLITKADGEREPFNPHKLEESLKRAGAPADIAIQIKDGVSKELYSGMTTQELYSRAFARLREARREVAARYSLKRAVLEFGPSGFPFEEYLAQLFITEGYTAQTDQIVPGKCVEHEVDVVMHKGDTTTYVEAKFHNTAGFKSDLKVALYVKARLDDIDARRAAVGTRGRMHGLLVTNTKFTSQAVQFASCAGLELLGWELPGDQTLHTRIEAAHLYPITVLTTLNRREKMALLEQKVVLCRELPKAEQQLAKAGVSPHKAAQALEEVEALCGTQKGLE